MYIPDFPIYRHRPNDKLVNWPSGANWGNPCLLLFENFGIQTLQQSQKRYRTRTFRGVSHEVCTSIDVTYPLTVRPQHGLTWEQIAYDLRLLHENLDPINATIHYPKTETSGAAFGKVQVLCYAMDMGISMLEGPHITMNIQGIGKPWICPINRSIV
jgi:hypothetical protein